MQVATTQKIQRPNLKSIYQAYERLKKIVTHTPLGTNINLSNAFHCQIKLKREDLQVVRSYKIRGAYNKISSLEPDKLINGVVCASAGNHAQGVAYSCFKLGITGKIFMPHTTPQQKVNQVEMFGKDHIEIILTGDTFDDSYQQALQFSQDQAIEFIHPFDDPQVIEGQGTVALEILEDASEKIDYLFVPVGGGGLAAGLAIIFKELSPTTKIIGVEPQGAPAMKRSLDEGHLVTLDKIDKFVDGAAVKRVGQLNFEICRDLIDEVVTVPEGKVCTTILQLYNQEAIVVEPAGALSIAVLDFYKDQIIGKNVVCIVSGSNNDITRTEEIKERSLLYEGLKHFFMVRFAQRPGALREFLEQVLGPGDDIVHFEYSKKNNREKGPALVGIEIKQKEDFEGLIQRMEHNNINYEYLNSRQDLLQYLI
ncbi:MAG: threonine ammonia-lyase [Bacteroidetes bacterium]|nr:threonine ammonia-lyase [Bacteroidota bacterium]